MFGYTFDIEWRQKFKYLVVAVSHFLPDGLSVVAEGGLPLSIDLTLLFLALLLLLNDA